MLNIQFQKKHLSICFLIGMVPVTLFSKLNFVVLLTDDQYYKGIGYNNPEVKTPNLDKLANGGMIFTHHFVASPICAASRAALMSGLSPQQNGVVGLDDEGFSDFIKGGTRADQTLPFQMTQAGYQTALYGKSGVGAPQTYGFTDGEETKDAYDLITFKQGMDFINLSETGKKPFLLWLGIRQPHVPLKPADKYLALYDEKTFKYDSNFREMPFPESINNQGKPGLNFYRDVDYHANWKGLAAGPPRILSDIYLYKKAYYATISHMDEQVAEFMDLLKTKSFYDSTVIIFLSDNGYHLGTHGLGNKLTAHEESVRVPMFISWSGLPKMGIKSDALVSGLDLYPTIMEMAGIKPPPHLMGKSLVPLFKKPDMPFRDIVFTEMSGPGSNLREGHRMVRNLNFKYILTDTEEEYYFDEVKDPWELTNIFKKSNSDSNQELRGLQNALKNWMKDIGDRTYPHAVTVPLRIPLDPAHFSITKIPHGFRLNSPKEMTSQVKIVSPQGELLEKFAFAGIRDVPTKNWKIGVYLLEYQSGSYSKNFKVTVE